MSPDLQPRRRRPLSIARLVGMLLFIGLAARLTRYLLDFPIWGDEAFVAVNFLLNDFSDMWQPLIYHQIVSLGYMWITLAVAKVFGTSEYALRSVALVGGIAALFIFWRFAWTTIPKRAAVLALGFMAAAYYVIRHGAEVKNYGTDLLVSVALSTLAWNVYRNQTSVARWIALIAFGAVAIWLSLPAMFVIGGIGLLLLSMILKRRAPHTLIGGAAFVAIVGVSAAVMVVTYAEPHARAVPEIKELGMWTMAFPLRQGWKLPLWLVVIHAGRMMAYPIGAESGGSSLTLLLVIIGAVSLWRSGRRDLLLLLLGPLLFALAAAAMEKYPYGGTVRTMIFMGPAFCLLAGLGVYVAIWRLPWSAFWELLGRPARPLRNEHNTEIRIAALILGFIGVGSIVNDLRSPFKTSADQEVRDTMREFAEKWRPGDRTIVYMALDPEKSPPTMRAEYPAAEGAPPAWEYRGDGAVVLFNLARVIHGLPLFAPQIEAIAAGDAARTWVIRLRGPKYDEFFDVSAERTYMDGLVDLFGASAARETTVLSRERVKQPDGTKTSRVSRELVIERFEN
ncbi:MAG: hypothetical protein KDA32_01230 [Phycisphaerales bacterium]|nr:hypothetical protein [Phycisphaerales bacterium]